MLQEIAMTPSTAMLVALISVGAFLAIRRMTRRGLCDCSDHCEGCPHKRSSSKCKGCSGCCGLE